MGFVIVIAVGLPYLLFFEPESQPAANPEPVVPAQNPTPNFENIEGEPVVDESSVGLEPEEESFRDPEEIEISPITLPNQAGLYTNGIFPGFELPYPAGWEVGQQRVPSSDFPGLDDVVVEFVGGDENFLEITFTPLILCGCGCEPLPIPDTARPTAIVDGVVELDNGFLVTYGQSDSCLILKTVQSTLPVTTSAEYASFVRAVKRELEPIQTEQVAFQVRARGRYDSAEARTEIRQIIAALMPE